MWIVINSVNISQRIMVAKKPDDVTSPKNAKLASAILRGAITPTKAQIKTMASIALDNAANHSKKRK